MNVSIESPYANFELLKIRATLNRFRFCQKYPLHIAIIPSQTKSQDSKTIISDFASGPLSTIYVEGSLPSFSIIVVPKRSKLINNHCQN